MTYKHFSVEERERMLEMRWQKVSLRSIAKALGRSHASISRELKRWKKREPNRRYIPRLAHEYALKRRKKRGREDRLKNDCIRAYAVSHLKRRWSPEQIAIRIRRDTGETISHEAIYQFIYVAIHQKGYGYLKPGHEDLRSYLRRRRKRRVPKGARRCQRVLKPSGISIEERPDVVNTRKRIGDWESDSVESISHKPGVNTLVERRTGFLFITKLNDKTSAATVSAIVQRMGALPEKIRRTLTLDNGPENSDWQTLEQAAGIRCFFAHAYASWERGTNENTNGLIRDYFPKKTDFSTISNEALSFVEQELNSRPRKRLQGRTPLEAISGALRG